MNGKHSLTKSVLFEHAIKALLRPLTRALIAQGMTAPQLYRFVKQSYVDAAVEELGTEATDSRVSVMTGVHRRDVKAMRADDTSDIKPVQRRVSTLATVVGRWMTDPKLMDESGLPRPMTRAEFDQLAAQTNRDIRPRTILDELQRQGLVTDDDALLALNPKAVFGPEDLDQKLDFFARNLGDHMEAAVDNLLAETPPHFERAAFFNCLAETSLDALEAEARKTGAEALRKVAQEAAAYQQVDHEKKSATHRFRFGIYFYREDEEE